MKRKWAYLALPILLAAGMLGAKWRAEHPTPTKEDLEVRAFMRNAFIAELTEDVSGQSWPEHYGEISPDEFKPFIDTLHTIPYSGSRDSRTIRVDRVVKFQWLLGQPREDGLFMVNAEINYDHPYSSVIVVDSDGSSSGGDTDYMRYNLHPATVKRWTELLLANPRIGPQLRARMK